MVHNPASPIINTNNGSLYMASLAFLPLGLPADDPFWQMLHSPGLRKRHGMERIFQEIILIMRNN